MDTVKDYLAPKTFSNLVFICSILQAVCGLVFTGIAINLKDGEAARFACFVPPEKTLTHKKQVSEVCFSKYQQHYNDPLRFYMFVLLSIWFPIIIAFAYSWSVRRRGKPVSSANINEAQTDGEADNQVQNGNFYVFFCYLFHLALRVLCGVLFIILQHALLFPRGFDFKFDCNLPPTEFGSTIARRITNDSQLNNTAFIKCQNEVASDKHTLWKIITFLNALFAFIMVLELIRLCRRSPRCKCVIGRDCVTTFITSLLTSASLNLQQCVDDYKKQVLHSLRSTGINLGTKSKDDFDELYINLLINTERAPHKFLRDMKRHEIYDVYMQVPSDSICLEEIKDLFYPNKDTKWKSPRNILVVGRPGIGKTVLTEKIMRDWASEVDDEFYHDKIAFYFKFRWFNEKDMKDMTLKTFLHNRTQLSDKEFETIYEEIRKHPEKAILIFDGLDEFNRESDCLNNRPPRNDPDIPMSPIWLFSKLISGDFLPEATVVLTSRPTANEFYSEFKFDRTVEIIGFTENKIEEHVTKFCKSHDRVDVKPKIWNHIKSSSDLLSSCYIPVNCWIVVTILFEKLKDSKNETVALPTTLTELYHEAVTHFNKNHFRKTGGQSSEEAMKKLQFLAFKGIEPMQLIFDSKLFDEQMKQSGLLNSLSNSCSQAQTQFCFIHLTIQEFLAAKHVIEMFSPEKIKQFISSHINSPKWHLVLQFIAGLLGKEIKMFQTEDGYKDCVLAFAKSFELTTAHGVFDVKENYTSLLIMKCLREVEDEEIVKEACETTAINDIVDLKYGYGPVTLTSSDWSAVFLVCKHMKNLKKLDLGFPDVLSEESHLDVLRLLEQRCVEELGLDRPPSSTTGNIFKTLMESKCSLNHEHSKLIKLYISYHDVTDEILSTMCEFFRNGHAVCLKELSFYRCEMSSRKLSIFCEVLDNKLCPELTQLSLGDSNIADEGLTKLCRTITKQKLLKLTKLNLWNCSLTNECVPALCELLRNECCNLIDLTLGFNRGINDEGLRILCEHALTNEHCKLERLNLRFCSLTDDCLPELCNALQHEHCRLNELDLYGNKFTEEGKKSILEIVRHELKINI